jgi:hypothetical protein
MAGRTLDRRTLVRFGSLDGLDELRHRRRLPFGKPRPLPGRPQNGQQCDHLARGQVGHVEGIFSTHDLLHLVTRLLETELGEVD